MMKKIQIAVFTVILGTLMSVVAVAQPIGRSNTPVLLKAVDNFTFVTDISGSMMMSQAAGIKKIDIAKYVLASINDRMPALDYSAALYTVCKVTNPVKMGEWNRATLGKAISMLPNGLGVYGRQTDLGDDIMAVQSGLRGAAVFVTDGASNLGPDVVAAFANAKRASGAKFAIISLADTKVGKANVQKIAAATQAYVVQANGLLFDPVQVDAFIKEMFYVEREAVVNSSVYFATGKYDLTPESIAVLDQAVETILNNPRGVRTVIVEGYADAQGGLGPMNQTLSENRAKAVKDYFINQGVVEDIIYYKGDNVSARGANKTVTGRHDNRRTDIILN